MPLFIIRLANGNLDSRYDYNGNSMGDQVGQWIIDGVCKFFSWLWNFLIASSYWICLLACLIAVVCFALTKMQKYKNTILLSVLFYIIIQGINYIANQ